jgi:hypothetical protein
VKIKPLGRYHLEDEERIEISYRNRQGECKSARGGSNGRLLFSFPFIFLLNCTFLAAPSRIYGLQIKKDLT